MENALIEELKAKIKADPNNKENYKNRGNAYYETGKECSSKAVEEYFSKAVEDYTSAIEIDKDYTEAYNNRANVYRDMGKFEEAYVDYEIAIRLKPKYGPTYEDRGNAHYMNKNYDAAIDDYNKSIELDPSQPITFQARGKAYRDKRNKENRIKALSDFDQAVKLGLNNETIYEARGNILRDMGKYGEALKDFDKVVELSPDYVLAYVNRGSIYLQQKRYSEAKADLEKAIELEENNAEAHINFGNYYLEIADYENALEEFKLAEKYDCRNPKVFMGKGNVYCNKKKYDMALDCFNMSIKYYESENDSFFAYHGLGLVFKAWNDYDNALINCDRAIELNNEFAEAYLTRGNIYFDNKYIPSAIKDYEKAIELQPTLAYAYMNLAKALYRQDEIELALENCEKALENFNSNDHFNIVRGNKLLSRLKALKEKISSVSQNVDSLMKKINKKCISLTLIKEERSFTKFISEDSQSKSVNSPEFTVLRRWNSYTPIMSDLTNCSRGGGYFIKTKNRGIVVDPGFDFIKNFLLAGYVFKDIDDVFISHAHNDHTADLESLLTLLYKYNDRIKGIDDFENEDTIFSELINNNTIEEKDIKDDSKKSEIESKVNTTFRMTDRHKKINLYMPLGAFKKYSPLLDLYNKRDYTVTVVKPDIDEIIEEITNKETGDKIPVHIENRTHCINLDGVNISIIRSKHDDNFSHIESVGFVFTYDDFVLVYTGDTGFDNNIGKVYKEIGEQYSDKNIVLLAHIGGFKDYEENYMIDIEKSYYKNHLGRLGIANLVEILKPDICIISEFGEEFRTCRKKLCKILKEVYDKTLFFPADIGFRINTDKKIYAISSLKEKGYKEEFLDPTEVETLDIPVKSSLHYYFGELDEMDVVQNILNT